MCRKYHVYVVPMLKVGKGVVEDVEVWALIGCRALGGLGLK